MSKFEKRDQIFIKTAFPLISDPTKLKPVTSTRSHTHIEEAQIYKPYVYKHVYAYYFFREGWKGCDFAKFGPYNFGALNKWTKLKTILCMNFRRCQRNRYEHFFSLTKLIFFPRCYSFADTRNIRFSICKQKKVNNVADKLIIREK